VNSRSYATAEMRCRYSTPLRNNYVELEQVLQPSWNCAAVLQHSGMIGCTPQLRFTIAMAQPKARAKSAGAGVQAARKHQGKPSQHKGSQKPASDADAKAIQLLLARYRIRFADHICRVLWRLTVGRMTAQPPPLHRQKQKRKEPPAAIASEPDAKRPRKQETREKTQVGHGCTCPALLWQLAQHTACALMHPLAHFDVIEAETNCVLGDAQLSV
jgi:hypothetical protein